MIQEVALFLHELLKLVSLLVRVFRLMWFLTCDDGTGLRSPLLTSCHIELLVGKGASVTELHYGSGCEANTVIFRKLCFSYNS